MPKRSCAAGGSVGDLRRRHALQQLDIDPPTHAHIVAQVNHHPPQQQAALLVSSRQWPLLAARMHHMHRDNLPFGQHLARLAPNDTSRHRDGSPSDTTTRLLLATHQALTTPLDAPLPASPRVSTAAARSRSTTAPTAPVGAQAPAEPAAVPAHRQQAASPTTTRTRPTVETGCSRILEQPAGTGGD